MKDILSNHQDLTNNTASQLIGLEISVVREKLGYWWILESQDVKSSGSRYTFTRAGVGKLTLYTNEKNIVIQTPASANWGDKRTKKLKTERKLK